MPKLLLSCLIGSGIVPIPYRAADDGGAGGAGGGTAAAPGAAAGGSAPPAAPPDWLSGADDDHKKWVETKGYRSPADVVKAARSLETQLGPGSIALPPEKDGKRDFTNWEGWKKLGVPDKADDYRLADGVKADPEMLTWFRGIAHEAKIPGGTFGHMVEKWNARMADIEARIVNEIQTASVATENALRAKWGSEYEERMGRISRVVPEPVAKVLGDALRADQRTLEYFDIVASVMAPHAELIEGLTATFADDGLTPAQAEEEIRKTFGDGKHAFWHADHADHKKAVERMTRLHQIKNRAATRAA